MIFLRGDNAVGIWNKKKGKIITFENDKFSTDDDFEITLLKDHGYKEVKEDKEDKEDKVEKSKGKPGRPKVK